MYTIKLKYARKKIKPTILKIPDNKVLARDMLYHKMMIYHEDAKTILSWMLDVVKKSEKAQIDKVKDLYNKMRQCDDIVIDCAHKLAPYQSPKLESIEVKKRVEHRYVMQVPQAMRSKDEWMQATGAEKLAAPIKTDEVAPSKPVKSIHDFDVDEDELETFKRTMN